MMEIAKELSDAFVTFASVVDGLSPFVKVSWIMLAVWTLAQVVWYRRVRVEAEPAATATIRKPARRRAARKRQAPAAVSPAPEVVPDLSLAATGAGETVYR